jgi:hypothetical protein
VEGLILNAVVKAKNLFFKSIEKKYFFDDLKQENPDHIVDLSRMENEAKSIPLVVRNMNFTVKEGVFTGRALMDSWINLWLRLNGVMSTNKTNTQLTIHLQSARLGIFSIKGTLLKRLRGLNLEGVSIIKDKIIVNLETVVLGGGSRQQRKPLY